MKNFESKKRSIVKTITFRIIATIMTIVLVFLFTENRSVALQIGFLEFTSKLVVYYVHERMWGMSDWGLLHKK